jgi:hypothetical protein
MYVGGKQISDNDQILSSMGITHIINCAGDVCENRFPDKFEYKTYFLKDSKSEVVYTF